MKLFDGKNTAAPTPEKPQDIKLVRLLWTDTAGLRRCRVIPYHRWEDVLENGVGLTAGCMALPAWGDVCAPNSGLGPIGVVHLMPDETTLRAVPWRPSHAFALANMHSVPGTRWQCCPRTALERVLQSLIILHGIDLQVGFETEFVLLDGPAAAEGKLRPVDRSTYAQSSALDASADVLDDVVEALDALGVGVCQIHAESGPGQFEVVTEHCEALRAVDGVVLTREAISAVAARHGKLASFLPKLGEGSAGSGAHLHFSLWKGEENLMQPEADGKSGKDHGLSTTAESFLAGCLAHLPGLLAFSLASPNSYARMEPGGWAGAFKAWGLHNKEAPLRVSRSAEDISSSIEFKAIDATANPYLTLAALAIAGMLGIQRNTKLPPPLTVDPSQLSEKECSRKGIQRLPTTLEDSLAAMCEDIELCTALSEHLGDPIMTALIGVRQSEIKHFEGKSLKEQVAELYDRY